MPSAPSRAPGQVLGLRARARVDDRRPRAVVRQRGGDPRALVGRAAARHHGEGQVGAIEARGDAHRVAQPQARDDVGGDLRRRRGGRGDERLRAQPARRVGEAEVVRAEVVAPLRDAVRLVDDEQPDVRRAQRLGEARRREALRGDVEQAHLARGGARQRGAVGRRVLLGVDQRGAARGDALERLDLVLHERHERRDHHREVVADQRRQLVAQRLAGARGHDDEDVARRRRGRSPPARPRPARGGRPRSRRLSAVRCGRRPWRASDHSGGPGGDRNTGEGVRSAVTNLPPACAARTSPTARATGSPGGRRRPPPAPWPPAWSHRIPPRASRSAVRMSSEDQPAAARPGSSRATRFPGA